MRKSICLGVVTLWLGLCLGLFPASEGLACSWDLNGVGYPASCGYRGGGGGGGGSYVAPAPYVPPPPSPAQIAAAQARPINQSGIQAEKAGNFALAVSLFEQAVRLSPGDAVLVNNLRHARAQIVDQQGLQAANAGNWVTALRFFEQAMQMLPSDRSYDKGRATLRNNIQQTRNHIQEQEAREKQLQQDKITAGNMQQTVQDLARSLSPASSSAGLNFKDATPAGNTPAPAGLPFMASGPAPAGNSPQASNSALPANTVQLNPGAKSDEALNFHSVDNTAAIKAGSAKEQLQNSGKETTGQLFDNGRAHDDIAVEARLPDVPTPLAQSPDARFAKNKDYQAAAVELAKTQLAAEALNRKMAGLQEQQKASPTPERQTEIYKLSGQLHEAGGAVAIATNNVETVKKKIIQEGPAIIVDDGTQTAEKSTPTSSPGKP